MTHIERLIARLMVWVIERGFGKGCETWDYQDFPTHPRDINDNGRCPSCVATEVKQWITRTYLEE